MAGWIRRIQALLENAKLYHQSRMILQRRNGSGSKHDGILFNRILVGESVLVVGAVLGLDVLMLKRFLSRKYMLLVDIVYTAPSHTARMFDDRLSR